jgi:hypothetical protein
MLLVGLLLGYPAGIATAIWSRSSVLTPQPAPMRTTTGQVRTGIEGAPADNRQASEAENRTSPLRARPSAARPVNTQAAASSSGMLHVESRPSGAQVLLDDKPVATTPFRLYRLPPGFHTVRMELEGYRPFSTSVEIAGGSLVRVSALLEPDAAPSSR